jgi:IclR family transcriptional regulator, acetate operon repressor
MQNKTRSSALEKALAVLEAILQQPQAVGLPDLAARLGLPRQTAHRLLTQLERTGLVVRDPSRERYSVGPWLSQLAFGTLRSLNQAAPIRSILQDLVDDIGETCNIGVLDGLEYLYLQRIECHWPLRLHTEIGSRMGAHMISGGKVLLAHLDPKLRHRLLRSRKLKASTSHTLTRVAELEAELAQIRTRGFALNNQERIDGIVGAAVPVVDQNGLVLAAVGMQGPLPRLTLKACERHVPRMRTAAERIARLWGDG